MVKIYLDHGATTPVDSEVQKAMMPYFSKKFGNASSLHQFGQEAAVALADSRKIIAKALNAEEDEIYFTSSGTESNNTILKGIAFANRNKGKHIITTKIEHDCVIHSSQWLESQGFSVTFLSVDKYGLVNPDDVKKAIQSDTILVSVMHANNEIGTIEPIREIGKICREKNVYFHTDACQSFTKIPLDVRADNLDLVTINAHKIYGPKGVGAFYKKRGIKIEPLFHGGGHERGLRSSTENVAGIVGFAKAAEIGMARMDTDAKKLSSLRDKLINGCLQIENTWLNGHPSSRLPNNANVGFAFIEGESIILNLDLKGIAASTGSACSSKSLEPSHVLLALGQKHEEAHGSVRFSLGRSTTEKDIDYVLKVLPPIIKRLRAMSPMGK
ncbi:MAG: cysteine desulfurase NifS [Nanoarchaeota archaeon]|nr:cysteine desulfurase NifS [Nanoarchaeota archaeon]MBU4299606.1 cysteine desulfurase NifS [Nanoarchaeota archaeon]MBU4451873.1 cysteine desulfurase NifS [Nanoarchaeota archaeon]MCG2723937.1 cysteine desulfurase NifS [archaeon]